MGAALVEMIPFALGKMIAVNPTIAVILLLVSANGYSKALAYLGGALLGPLVAGTALLALASTVMPPQHSEGFLSLGSAPELVIGLSFLVLAYRCWHQRTARNASTPALPGWMQKLDRISTTEALGLGAAMTIFGVKNLLMLGGVVVMIGGAGLIFIQQEIVLAAFVAISTIPVAVPLVATKLLGPRAADLLDGWKAWLVRNATLVMLVLFLFVGAYFLFKGLYGLTGAAFD